MNTTTTRFLAVLGALALATVHWASAAPAQNHVVAIGQIDSLGNLVNSTNTVGGEVSSVWNGVGDYTITVTASGAFANTTYWHYAAEVTCKNPDHSDRIAHVRIMNGVHPGKLPLKVRIYDLEDATDADTGEPRNNAFFFSIYRIPDNFSGKGSTKFLLSTGKVDSDGNLLSGLRMGNADVSSVRRAWGRYEVTISKAGAFAGMGVDDFVPILTHNVSDHRDIAIQGNVTAVNADEVVIQAVTADVQTTNNDYFIQPTIQPFYFTLYQIPSGNNSGPAKSQALIAFGTLHSHDATLFNCGAFGGSAAIVWNGPGNYTVIINAPGAFANPSSGPFAERSSDEFVAQAHLFYDGFDSDETISADLTVVDENFLALHVLISDAETADSDEGTPTGHAFFFTVYDTVAAHRPDLRIGKKRSLTKHKGDGIYNDTGAGQKIRVKLRDRKNGKSRKKKYFFVAENDGNVVDNLRLRGTRSGRQIRTKYFRITGGRQNVTGALRTGNLTLDELFPGEQVRFRGVAKFKKNAKRKRKKIAYRTHSLHDAAKRDAAKAILKRKKRK